MTVREIEKTTTHRADASPVPNWVVAFFGGLRKIFGKAEDQRDAHDEGTWTLRVSIEPDELDGGFVAECIDMPGVASQGETQEEALKNLIDAIQGVLAVRMEEHLKSIDFDMPGEPRIVSVAF